MTRPHNSTLNPIEPAFDVVKSYLKGHRAQALRSPLDTIATALRSVTHAQAISFFVRCGWISYEAEPWVRQLGPRWDSWDEVLNGRYPGWDANNDEEGDEG